MSKKDKHDHKSDTHEEQKKSASHGDEKMADGRHHVSPNSSELAQKLDESEKKAAQYWERIVRMQADWDNMARRNERDIANAHKYALEKFVSELIPIVDSLELCVATVPKTDESTTAVVEGVDLTLKMFYTALEKFGVKQINPLNEPFNPEFEQAISVQHKPGVKPGTVIAVLQKGYTLNNRLIRPALVTVSQAEAS